MTINLSPLAASATSLIASVAAINSPSILQLVQAKQAGYELGLITMSDLDVKIQWWVDNSATLTPDELQQVRFLTMPARIRASIENNIEYFGTSQDIIIPENCYLLKVSFQAAGGNSGQSQTGAGTTRKSGGGGGGGGYVKYFEIAVSPGQTLTLTKGDSLTLGPLYVGAGGKGGDYDASSRDGGLGGEILMNGIYIEDSATVIKGGKGQTGTVNTYTIFTEGNTSNGKIAGIGGGYDTSPTQYYGVGGGACGSFDGEDAIYPATTDPDLRVVNIGVGASSGSSKDSTDSGYVVNAASRTGGAASPFVEINFVKQTA